MRKPKPHKPRNWHAVNAFRRHAGPMSDERKKHSKNACRDWTVDDEVDEEKERDWEWEEDLTDGYGE